MATMAHGRVGPAEEHLKILSLKTGSSESIHVKMPHCWKSHVMVQLLCAYNLLI